MIETSPRRPEIRQIIAADYQCGEVTPQDDQIWELSTARGEPPAVALFTTYGLRAYGMRVFPRFIYKNSPVSDPRAFANQPVLEYAAPNFLSLTYSPFSLIDVQQKVWVPDSHTLVGQVTLHNNTNSLQQFAMEWVAMLNPLLAGTSMSAAQIGVNTILQGHTQHLYPVFFLTGGPQPGSSALPSLEIEINLNPHNSRQFTWAMASLDSTNTSFLHARKTTAYNLENEEIKIRMAERNRTVRFIFSGSSNDDRLLASQNRMNQLLLPPCREFNQVSYATSRLPDQGFTPSEKGTGFASEWGVQKLYEVLEISRGLLPARPEIVRGMLQNFLDQQGDNGTIYAQTGWTGNITRLAAPPMLAELVAELHEYIQDIAWLRQVYPALLRSVKIWLDADNDSSDKQIPQWNHLLQTGITESTFSSSREIENLEMLLEVAEWPALLALLIQECQALLKIAGWIGDPSEIPWLEEQLEWLKTLIGASWNDQKGYYAYLDKDSRLSIPGKKIHAFKQSGEAELQMEFLHPVRIGVRVRSQDGSVRPVVCQVKGRGSKRDHNLTLSGRDFRWQAGTALAFSSDRFTSISKITVSGLKKGDVLSVEAPDLSVIGPDFMIPLWAGIPSDEQAGKLIQTGTQYLKQPGIKLPNFLKILWIEGLIRYDRVELASRFYKAWFFDPVPIESEMHVNLKSGWNTNPGLRDLIPVKTLLQLMGVQKITPDELLLKGFNEFFPLVNVQYKKFTLTLDAAQAQVTNLNGGSVLVNDPATHRITLS